MGHILVNRAGLAVAGVLAGWHAVWAALVAFGVAQPLMDFAYRLHFMGTAPAVGPFKLATAVILVLTTGLVGYATGATLALAWNCLNWWMSPESATHQEAVRSRPSTPARAS